jgi:chemotaxis protein MotB
MARKRSKCECPAGEKWAVPYADFLSLLLALFIALYALASVNIEKQKALKEEFMKIYGFNPASDTMKEQEQTEKSMTDKQTDADVESKKASDANLLSSLDNLENKNAQSGDLIERKTGTTISLPPQLVFESGKAELTNQYAPEFLTRLAKIISSMPKDTQINVKGYADEDEIKGTKYKDTLDLSTARANNIVRELIKYDIAKERLYSTGFGSSKAYQMREKRIVQFEFTNDNPIQQNEAEDQSVFQNEK